MSEQIELVLKKPIEELVPAMIAFNEDEIIGNISETVEFYKTATYTADTMKTAKEDGARLNNLKKALNSERIAIGKIYDEPYMRFKEKIDRIINYIDEASGNIKKQVDEHEAKRKAERHEILKTYYAQILSPELLEAIPFERVEQSQWLNASVSEKKAKGEIDKVVEGIATDLQTIETLSDEDKDELRLYYYNALSIQKTLQENERRKEEKRKIAEMKAKREEAARIAEEEAKKAAEAEFAPQSGKAEEKQEAAPAVPPEFIPPEKEEPKQYFAAKFQIVGTYKQLADFKQSEEWQSFKKYLNNNGLQLEKI